MREFRKLLSVLVLVFVLVLMFAPTMLSCRRSCVVCGVEVLPGWEYVRPIDVEERFGVDLINYPVRVVLNSSNFDFGKVNPDGSDLRFTDSYGNFLPFYIAVWDYGRLAVIWVKVYSIPANSKTLIYMYYGNPGAEPPPYSMDDVFEFMEVRTITVPEKSVPDEWFWFSFLHEFRNAPVIIAEPDLTFNGPEELRWRLKGINTTGFHIAQQEPGNRDNIHASENVTYIAVPEGSWLAIYNISSGEGVRVEAGKFQTSNWVSGDGDSGTWTTVEYYYGFSESPVVFTQIQDFTYTGEAHTRITDVGTLSFKTAPEPQGNVLTPPSTLVTVGWVAVEKHVVSGFSEAGVGVWTDEVWSQIIFQQTYSRPPHVVAWMQTYLGGDSSGVRSKGLTAEGVYVKVEEDTTYDFETDHVDEAIGYYAVSSEISKIYLRPYVPKEPKVVLGREVRLAEVPVVGGVLLVSSEDLLASRSTVSKTCIVAMLALVALTYAVIVRSRRM